jgi:protocatechuate 3,4-dioxygenase beta subunit
MIQFLSQIRRAVQSQNHRSRSRLTKTRQGRRESENLESRIVLSAVVGTVYDDADGNGVRNNGENGLTGWTVYLDLDNSGTLNNRSDGTLEPSAVTNKDGDYVINSVLPGTYRVTEIAKPGWTPTQPISQDLTVTSGKDSKLDFFNFGGGTIVGTVWNDLSEDGVRAVDPETGEFTEPGLAGWTVFLDLKSAGGGRNGILDSGEPSTLTDSLGNYSFSNLPAGDYEVTEIQPDGWDVSPGFDTKQTATVVALGTARQDFANFSVLNGSIEGTIWNDIDGDGDRAIDPATGLPTEPGLADWTVFIDANGNGVLDDTEISTTTGADGSYYFVSLPEGGYLVREVLPENWEAASGYAVEQTVEVIAGKKSNNVDFANFTILNGSIRGTVWNDVNRDGVRNASLSGAFSDPGLAGWTVYLDMNRSGALDPGEPTALTDADGAYVFADLQIGEYEVIEVVPTGWETAPTFGDNYTVRVYSGAESVAHDFANFNLSTTILGSVSGIVWNDLNENGNRETLPTAEPGLGGRVVFADMNANGFLDTTDPQTTTKADGTYTISGIAPGTISIVDVVPAGWHATSPITSIRSIVLKNGENALGINYGNAQLKNSTISGAVFADTNKNGVRDPLEHGLAGITVYLDLNNNGTLDPAEPQTVTSADLYYTPSTNEAGSYSFSHLAPGTYAVRQVIPAELSSTPSSQFEHSVTMLAAENHSGVDFADVFRPNEIHGVKFDDANGNHVRDPDERGVGGTPIFIDANRNDVLDADEMRTVSLPDGSYSFTGLTPGAYVIREVLEPGFGHSYPTTTGGTLWPSGTSNPAQGIVSPTSITTSLAVGQSYFQSISLTLPGTGALTNAVDVFLLFDDTGSFVNNSPIVRAAFPNIITDLQTSLSGIDLAFGVGRFEEYANFASEYSTGRPFILNQPIVAASTAGYMTAIQAALNRTTPGYGGDGPETDIEALYQLVTGLGFDGNNNGSVMDSGAAGLGSTQLIPGNSGDVPSFASFTADASANVLPAAGTVGGAGFRAGALPVILLATDIGFAYQPKGETSVTGVNGLTLPVSSLTGTSRASTPFNSGAGLQETITGLNALGALVIGLGTNTQANVDPRQGLEAISKLTGATNRSSATIANGTADPIAPGDPFYFQISTGFAGSVADGVRNAIQNAVTNVAVNITVQASDPRVRIINHSGTRNGVGSGQTATFDIEFIGDGVPHRFDLQFVREGTNVVLGSIPVVLGTPIPGDGYHFDDLSEGELEFEDHFGDSVSAATPPNVAPSFVAGANQVVAEDAGSQSVARWANGITAGPASEAGQIVNFVVTNDNPGLFIVQPTISANGTLTFTSAPDAFGTSIVTVVLHDNGGTDHGGIDTSSPQLFTITVTAVNDAPVANSDSFLMNEGSVLTVAAPGVLGNDADVDNAVLTANLVSAPLHGSLTLNTDGDFTYIPGTNFHGTDSFTYVASDGSLNSAEATVTITVVPVLPPPADSDVHFFVVDSSSRRTFEYDNTGGLLKSPKLNKEDNKPMGVASNSDGTLLWVVDEKGEVFVYDNLHQLLGSWEIEGVDKAQGITVHGSDLWIVDRGNDRVYLFSGAADRRFGKARPASSFELARANRNPKDLVTDGAHIWVLNDTDSVDRVFRYSVSGQLEGSWAIDPVNSQPTGITLAPDTSGNIWIVDSLKDRAYEYQAAASLTSGSAIASSGFALNSQDGSPQGIAVAVPPSAKAAFAAKSIAGPVFPTSTKSLFQVGPEPVSRLDETLTVSADYASVVAPTREQDADNERPRRNDEASVAEGPGRGHRSEVEEIVTLVDSLLDQAFAADSVFLLLE